MKFYNFLLKKLDYWIFDSYKISPRDQSIYRIVYSLFILLVFGVPNWTWLSNISDVLYDPPRYSLAALFSSFPSYNFLLLLGLIISVLYVLLLFGYKTKIVSILIAIIYILGNSFMYSRSKIDHNDLLLIITPLIMAFSNWGNYYSIDSKISQIKNKISYWPISLLSLTIGFAFFTAGIPKLLGGWLILKTHAVKGTFYGYFYSKGYQSYLAPYFTDIENDIFWELFDYCVVFIEVSFLIVVFIPLFFRFYIFIAVIFHLLNLLILNINFVHNIATYALYFNYSYIRKITLNPKIYNLFDRILSYKFMIFIIVLQLFFYTTYLTSPIQYMVYKFNFEHLNLSLLIIATVIGSISMILYFKKLIKKTINN